MLGSIYCRNSDTLGPIVWLEQGNQGDQGDQHKQDDQGELSIIIFGISESSGFQKNWQMSGASDTLSVFLSFSFSLSLHLCPLMTFE